MDIRSGWIRLFSLINWSGNEIAFCHKRLIRINEKAPEVISEAFLIEPLLERLQINVWFLAIFPLLMTNGKNLFSGIDQAVKNYGDHDHKK